MRKLICVLLVCVPLAAQPRTPAPRSVPAPPKPVAPDTVAHPMAQFLRALSNDGGREVRFKATAVGKRFFIEEPAGVTVYAFENGDYRREAFLAKTTLAKAVAKYATQKD